MSDEFAYLILKDLCGSKAWYTSEAPIYHLGLSWKTELSLSVLLS